jgi:hypothetical protein
MDKTMAIGLSMSNAGSKNRVLIYRRSVEVLWVQIRVPSRRISLLIMTTLRIASSPLIALAALRMNPKRATMFLITRFFFIFCLSAFRPMRSLSPISSRILRICRSERFLWYLFSTRILMSKALFKGSFCLMPQIYRFTSSVALYTACPVVCPLALLTPLDESDLSSNRTCFSECPLYLSPTPIK